MPLMQLTAKNISDITVAAVVPNIYSSLRRKRVYILSQQTTDAPGVSVPFIMKPEIIPLPIHFKTPGRSYNQLGRKGNVALYSVYSDYLLDRNTSLPYVLLGFELIVIKSRKGKELYPRSEQFGTCAWSIPKSLFCFRRIGSRSCDFRRPEFRSATFATLLNRSATSEVCSHLAAGPA